MSPTKKPGRPRSENRLTALRVSLDDERLRQNEQFKKKFGMNDSSSLAHAIAWRHDRLKQEFPDDFD